MNDKQQQKKAEVVGFATPAGVKGHFCTKGGGTHEKPILAVVVLRSPDGTLDVAHVTTGLRGEPGNFVAERDPTFLGTSHEDGDAYEDEWEEMAGDLAPKLWPSRRAKKKTEEIHEAEIVDDDDDDDDDKD